MVFWRFPTVIGCRITFAAKSARKFGPKITLVPKILTKKPKIQLFLKKIQLFVVKRFICGHSVHIQIQYLFSTTFFSVGGHVSLSFVSGAILVFINTSVGGDKGGDDRSGNRTKIFGTYFLEDQRRIFKNDP